MLPQRADCPSTSDQLHPPLLLSLLAKTTALLRPSSTPCTTHPQKRVFRVLAEMCNHLHTSEDVFSPLKIDPGHISSHPPTLVSPLSSRQCWPNCQSDVCLDTSGGEVYRNHIPHAPCLSFSAIARSRNHLYGGLFQTSVHSSSGPAPSIEGAFLYLRQCYLSRALVMAAWFFLLTFG